MPDNKWQKWFGVSDIGARERAGGKPPVSMWGGDTIFPTSYFLQSLHHSSDSVRPRTHWQFYPTREPFASGSRRVARIHTASTASGSSGTLRPHQDVFAVDANGSRRLWLCSVNARVDASGTFGRERRSVCAYLQTDLFIFNDSIHMTRKGDICHELSTCNWVTTGREADAVCTRRSGRVPFASCQSFVV